MNDTLTPRQQQTFRMLDFRRCNREAMEFSDKGVSDYISARCLMLNGLLAEGLTQTAQAVEKILKCHYRLRGGTMPFGGHSGLGHRIPRIAHELLRDSSIQFDLSQYAQLFDRLVVNYDLRYPDNRDRLGLTQWSRRSDELNEVDDLMWHLFTDYPVPTEIKVLTGYFGVIARHLSQPENPYAANDCRWLREHNDPINRNWAQIIGDFESTRIDEQ